MATSITPDGKVDGTPTSPGLRSNAIQNKFRTGLRVSVDDDDSVSQKHIAEFFALLGGGMKEPGWQNTRLSKARLAIVPGYSHYNFVSAPELAPIIDKYLADPLTNPPVGAAAASQAAPDRTKSG